MEEECDEFVDALEEIDTDSLYDGLDDAMNNNTGSKRTSKRDKDTDPDKEQSTNRELVVVQPVPEQFDVRLVILRFKQSIADQQADDVDMAEYIIAYSELNKMFSAFGVMFQFVERDVCDKNRILQSYLDDIEHGHDYRTVKTMLDYEAKPGFTPRHKHAPTGSRTLLRLHRAMGFLIEFVRGVHTSSHDSSMAHVCRHAYDTTLARFHPWLIRKGVHVAVYALPTRRQLLLRLAGAGGSAVPSETNDADVDAVLLEVVTHGETVYHRVQRLYTQRNLLHLP